MNVSKRIEAGIRGGRGNGHAQGKSALVLAGRSWNMQSFRTYAESMESAGEERTRECLRTTTKWKKPPCHSLPVSKLQKSAILDHAMQGYESKATETKLSVHAVWLHHSSMFWM